MKSLVTPALAGFAAFLAIGCAATNTTAPSTPPSATVKIQEWSAAYDVSAATGKGTLTFKGRNYPFTISGFGAGGTGVQKMSATGKVYNMNSLSDFSGTFSGISKGLTLIEGRMHSKLTNGNGVVMYIAGETEGLASATGVREFNVSLTN
ncbi:MAG: DUF1134 domain-containing protein [Verrucomicrobia bacterium]|nr:DUF1134 domain-containing protein [Verrucomicrobiota bacterium]